jgi:hypothetical protein
MHSAVRRRSHSFTSPGVATFGCRAFEKALFVWPNEHLEMRQAHHCKVGRAMIDAAEKRGTFVRPRGDAKAVFQAGM